MDESTPLKVALLGCGTVGSMVARLLIEQADDLEARIGRPLELVGIAVRRRGLLAAPGRALRETIRAVVASDGPLQPGIHPLATSGDAA